MSIIINYEHEYKSDRLLGEQHEVILTDWPMVDNTLHNVIRSRML